MNEMLSYDSSTGFLGVRTFLGSLETNVGLFEAKGIAVTNANTKEVSLAD